MTHSRTSLRKLNMLRKVTIVTLDHLNILRIMIVEHGCTPATIIMAMITLIYGMMVEKEQMAGNFLIKFASPAL